MSTSAESRYWGTVNPDTREKLDQWKAEGAYQPSAILSRINESIAHTLELLKEGPLHDTGRIDQEEFVLKLLKDANFPPSWAAFIRIIYQSLSYLSSAPFYPLPGSAIPSSLSAGEIQRGLLWILPKLRFEVLAFYEPSRHETRANHYRMLFQSLATIERNATCNPDKARQRAARNASVYADQSWTMNPQDLILNYDDDGDEIFHDLYLTLTATQPDIESPALIRVPQYGFLQLSKEIAKTLPKLHTLAIPVGDLSTVVTYLLALQFDHESQTLEALDLSIYKDAAESIVMMFCGGSKIDLITWPIFDDAMVQVPFLFEPLFRALTWGFLYRDCSGVSGLQKAPEAFSDDSLLPAPRMSQLATTLNRDIDFSHFERAHVWRKGPRPTATVILHALESMPSISLLVVRGSTQRTREEYLFCVFSPAISKIEKRIEDEKPMWSTNPDEKQPPIILWRDTIHDYIQYNISGEYHEPIVARPVMTVLSPSQRTIRLTDKLYVSADGSFTAGDQLQIWDNGSAVVNNGESLVKVIIDTVEIWGETTVRK